MRIDGDSEEHSCLLHAALVEAILKARLKKQSPLRADFIMDETQSLLTVMFGQRK